MQGIPAQDIFLPLIQRADPRDHAETADQAARSFAVSGFGNDADDAVRNVKLIVPIMPQHAAGIGDASSEFGGIGRNGALLTPEAVASQLLSAGSAYKWQAGKFHNLQADAFIKGHSDVTGPEGTWAWMTAFAST
mgnify:CR=1 FL=1